MLEGELPNSFLCLDLSFLLLWHNNLWLSNSDIWGVNLMWLDNTVPYDQHVWQFNQKLICNPFSILTSRHTDYDRLYLTIQLYGCDILVFVQLSMIAQPWTHICWWIIEVNKEIYSQKCLYYTTVRSLLITCDITKL